VRIVRRREPRVPAGPEECPPRLGEAGRSDETVLFTPCEYHQISPFQLSASCRYTTVEHGNIVEEMVQGTPCLFLAPLMNFDDQNR